MGTALFTKVYRIATKWYGNPTENEVLPQVFDSTMIDRPTSQVLMDGDG